MRKILSVAFGLLAVVSIVTTTIIVSPPPASAGILEFIAKCNNRTAWGWWGEDFGCIRGIYRYI